MLKPGKTYGEVYQSFQWIIPEYYNIGVDICDKWAHQRYRLALIYEEISGKVAHRCSKYFLTILKFASPLVRMCRALTA